MHVIIDTHQKNSMTIDTMSRCNWNGDLTFHTQINTVIQTEAKSTEIPTSATDNQGITAIRQ